MSGDLAGPDEPYRDNPHGRLYDSDDGYYMVEPDGSIWELDLSGYRVDALPPGSVEMRPVSASPAGLDEYPMCECGHERGYHGIGAGGPCYECKPGVCPELRPVSASPAATEAEPHPFVPGYPFPEICGKCGFTEMDTNHAPQAPSSDDEETSDG